MSKLRLKQQLFVEAYVGVAQGNASKAARKAGYKGNDATLRAIASQNLTKPNIIAAIAERTAKIKNIMSRDEVLEELSDIARAPWQEFLEIRHDKDGNIIDAQLKLADKIKALDLVGKAHGIYMKSQENPADKPDKEFIAAYLQEKFGWTEERARQVTETKMLELMSDSVN